MKIAMFSDCYLDLTGGIQTVMNAEKKALEKRGHTVYIFTTGYPRKKAEIQKFARENIFLVPSCRYFLRGLTPVSRRPRIVEKWILKNHPEIREFDVFYIHYEGGCSITGILMGEKLGIPVVQKMHGREDMGESNIIPLGFRTLVAEILNAAHGGYLKHTVKVPRDDYLADSRAKAKMWELMVNHANAADAVVSPSEHFRKKLEHYGVARKVVVIPNGLDGEKFPEEVLKREISADGAASLTAKNSASLTAKNSARLMAKNSARKKSENRELKIIWHSRVSAEKRMMPFLRALKLLPKEGWRMDVFGGGGDFYRARRFARKNKMKVKFHGNTSFSELEKYLKKADLDVLVSYNFDTFGMTLIEAEAFGVPVLICDSDLAEVVPEKGAKLSGESSEEMARAIAELLAEPERITKMSREMARRRDEVRISRRIEPLEKLFSSMI